MVGGLLLLPKATVGRLVVSPFEDCAGEMGVDGGVGDALGGNVEAESVGADVDLVFGPRVVEVVEICC